AADRPAPPPHRARPVAAFDPVAPSAAASCACPVCRLPREGVRRRGSLALFYSCRPACAPSPMDGDGAQWGETFQPGSGLADFEAGEAREGHAGLVQERLDGLLVVLDRRLLQQDVVLVVRVDLALDDLRQRLLGLAF